MSLNTVTDHFNRTTLTHLDQSLGRGTDEQVGSGTGAENHDDGTNGAEYYPFLLCHIIQFLVE